MIKEVKYGGYSANPNDHEALEGDLAVAMNLVPEHGTIRPVLPPTAIASVPGDPYLPPNDKGRVVFCIHKTSAYEHYIVGVKHQPVSSRPPYWHLYQWDGTESGTLERLGMVAFNEIYKVEPVGNTLVVLADNGVHYLLWKGEDNGYLYLGRHFPETHISFNVNPVSVSTDGQAINSFALSNTAQGHFTVNMTEETSTETTERHEAVKNAILGAKDRFVSEMRKLGYYTDPFIVRYAYRLYDGSLVMHSSPIYIGLEHFYNMYITVSDIVKRDKFDSKMEFDGWVWIKFFDLYLEVVKKDENLNQWKDIIKSVDFFMSPPLYVYDQNDVTEPAENMSKASMDMLYPGLVNDTWTGPLAGNIVCYGAFTRDRDFEKKVRDCSIFYLCKSVKLENIDTLMNFSIDKEAQDVGVLVTREPMSDDFRSHDLIRARQAFAYNNRINLASVSRVIADTHNPASLFCGYNNISKDEVQVAFHIKKNGLTEIVVSGEKYDLDSASPMFYLYHYNSNAFKATIKRGDQYFEVDMKPHDFLNGSVYVGTVGVYDYDPIPVATSIRQLPSSTEENERVEQLPNQVFTSEVNNPFFFPVTSINTVGTGNIIGICAAVRPVSTGQFGYADLYIFTDEGVWVAKINDKGTYTSITLATGDVCINAASITQMETAVLFTTARGIMLLSGSQAQCISGAIDDKGAFVTGMAENIGQLAGMLGFGDIVMLPFREFLQGCSMLYDYSGQRIIVYNPTTRPVDGGFAAVFPYAYIYSLESNKWGMMQSDISYTVNAYPDALAVINGDGNPVLVNYSKRPVDDGSAVVKALLLTRPLTLDSPDTYKTIDTVIQRGLFDYLDRQRDPGPVRCVLYGSVDLYNWQLVSSSADHFMRGFHGSPYKWFRVALLLELKPGESVTGCTVQFTPRLTNQPR